IYRKRTSAGKGLRSTAGLSRIQRPTQGRDRACLHRVYTFAVILTILVAVATALIASSIDMPDTVLREHQVSLHASGSHAANNLLNTGIPVPIETVASDAISWSSEITPSTNNLRTQSSIVMRC